MTSDWAYVLAALIAALPPTLAIFWSHRKNQAALGQVHQLVNDRLERALAELERVRDEVRILKINALNPRSPRAQS